jgi:hypothetical protein
MTNKYGYKVVPDHRIQLQSEVREKTAKDVERFLRSGGKVYQAALGESGLVGGALPQFAKGQKSGLKQILVRKEA